MKKIINLIREFLNMTLIKVVLKLNYDKKIPV